MSTGGISELCEMTVTVNGRENVTGYTSSEQLARLTNKVLKLEKRLSSVEEKLESTMIERLESTKRHSLSNSVIDLSNLDHKHNGMKPRYGYELVGARKAALATVNRTLITCKPYNRNFISNIRNLFVTMKGNPFSIFQFALLLLMIATFSTFGILSFKSAYNSTNDKFKPFKIEGKVDYYESEELIYQIPSHFFIIEADVASEPDFYKASMDRYGVNCTNRIKECLKAWFEDFLNVTYGPPEEPWAYSLVLDTYMSTNITVSVENPEDQYDYHIVVIKIDYNNLDFQVSDYTEFDKYFMFDMMSFNEYFSSILSFWEIFFAVSRMDYSASAPDRMDLFYYHHRVWESVASYALTGERALIELRYEESTYDGVSDFYTMIYNLEGDNPCGQCLLIQTIAYPIIVKYISYDRYSYADWLADLGGFFSLATTLFFVLSKKVTNYANRNDPFHRRQGILPIVSKTYKNSEELAGVRYLILSALGISEETYFAD